MGAIENKEPWRDVAARFIAEQQAADAASRGIAQRFLAQQPPAPGPQGEPGPQGPQGDVGPVPMHQWEGPRLRFERPDGKWGEWQDLEGPAGAPGARIISGGGPGPQGPQGAPGAGGTGPDQDPNIIAGYGYPTYIPPGKTWLIAKDTKVLATGIIEVDGYIDFEGLLVFVD